MIWNGVIGFIFKMVLILFTVATFKFPEIRVRVGLSIQSVRWQIVYEDELFWFGN